MADVQNATLGALNALRDAGELKADALIVIGASSSEIVGKKIGTGGSGEAAAAVVEAVLTFSGATGIQVAFQCCEHLNRALVVERQTAKERGLVIVHAIPIPGAGGSVASTAFSRFNDAVLVESIAGDAGLDIGDTWVGMHLRPVVVPVRLPVTSIGQAHVTAGYSRPKLIGGARAVYVMPESGGAELTR